MHDLRHWQVDLDLVHVTRLDAGAGRTESGVVHHSGLVLPSDLVEEHGIRRTHAARAAIETASLTSTESALVTLDSALQLGKCTRDELDATYRLMQCWPGMRRVQVAVRLADAGAQSVGESRSRYLFYSLGLPAPRLQFEVFDASGRLVGITDFAWPERGLLGEFDGKVKYGRLLRDGDEPGDAVFREKVREDSLREVTGWRLDAAHLGRPVPAAGDRRPDPPPVPRRCLSRPAPVVRRRRPTPRPTYGGADRPRPTYGIAGPSYGGAGASAQPPTGPAHGELPLTTGSSPCPATDLLHLLVNISRPPARSSRGPRPR